MGTPLTHTARPCVLELIAPLTASRSAPAVSLVSGAPSVGAVLSAYRCRLSAGEKKIRPMRIFAFGALLRASTLLLAGALSLAIALSLAGALLLAGAFGPCAPSGAGAAPLIAGTSATISARESPRSSG
jgi:hypothetical protein